MIHKIYAQPLGRVITEILLGMILWAVLSAALGKKKPSLWRILNMCLLVISVFAVILLTVIRRTPGDHELILMPGYFLQEAKIQPEIYRSLLMNVLLFTPFGLSLSAVLVSKIKPAHSAWITVLIALGLSIAVEATQYLASLGRAEVDDVLANTLGALIGALHVPVGIIMDKAITEYQKRNEKEQDNRFPG